MNELTLFDPMMTLVAQNIKNREATPEESLIIDVAIVNNENQRRSLAWLAREGKTWKNITNPATGEMFESFEEYGKFRLKLEKTNLHDLANAYRVQSVLQNSDMSEKEIPLRSAIQLNKLPDSAMPETYQHAIELAREEGKKLGAKHVEEAVNEWREKHEQAQKRISFLEMDKKAIHEQNDNLRNEIAYKVDAKAEVKAAEMKAQIILENQQAIADAKRIADNLAGELERLKKEQEKAIKDGIGKKMLELDNEIRSKKYSIERQERMIADLRKTYQNLDSKVGALSVHKEAIKSIKSDLTSLTVSFSDAFDTGTIPNEVTGDWSAIYDALSKLLTQMAEWRGNSALIGELVD